MKRTLFIISILIAAAACKGVEGNPYDGHLNTLAVSTVYPEGFESFARSGVQVAVEDVNLGNRYVLPTDGAGRVSFELVDGLYRVTVSDRCGEDIFNGTTDKFPVSGNGSTALSVPLMHSKAGSIVVKEIYCGGCKKLPQEGDYQADQYVMLHNNDVDVQYLDNLCFGTLYPYNSNATNPFVTKDPVTGESVYADYLPIAQAVWKFGGDGTTFPLAPGEDAVLVLRGAVDHTVQYPLSVNLNRPGYFVCYNNTYFTNTTFHPAPGDQIAGDHILDVVIKTGRANAYTFSINSPTVLLFRAEDMTIEEFVKLEGSVVQVPGSPSDQVVAVPFDWVVDAVEVFNGSSSSNAKRLVSSLDAGYVLQSDSFLGHSLMRKTDEALSASSGYEVLEDTNNSSADFYETEKQSLHE